MFPCYHQDWLFSAFRGKGLRENQKGSQFSHVLFSGERSKSLGLQTWYFFGLFGLLYHSTVAWIARVLLKHFWGIWRLEVQDQGSAWPKPPASPLDLLEWRGGGPSPIQSQSGLLKTRIFLFKAVSLGLLLLRGSAATPRPENIMVQGYQPLGPKLC